NFTTLWNYLQTYGPFGTPGLCMSNPFEPYVSEKDAPECFGAHWSEAALGNNTAAAGQPQFSESDIWGASLRLNYDLGPVEIVSITAYREISSEFARDQDLTPHPIAFTFDDFDQNQLSQELQIKGLSFDERLTWIIGGYFFDEHIDNVNDVIFTPVAVRSGGIFDNQSIAVFGQGTFDVTDRLHLTAGGRWTRDDKTFDSQNSQFVLQSFVGPGIAYGFDECGIDAIRPEDCLPTDDTDGIPQTGPFTIFGERVTELETSEFTPSVSVSFDVSDTALAYFSYSQGFKSGGFTQRVFPPLEVVPTVDPEEVTVYEVGFKSALLDNRLRVNGAIFHTAYRDLQIQGFTPETGVAPVYFNAGRARIRGVELDFLANPFEGFFIEGSMGYLDPEYVELADSIQQQSGILLENQFERISDWTASIGAQYEYILAPTVGSIRPRIDWSYRSELFFNARNSEEVAQPGYSVVNGTLAYTTPDRDFELIFGVLNMFDKDYFVSAIVNDNFAAFTATPDRGRQWFLRGQVAF
ncbi:MAG: TonB-dependent receptor, partial [Pseudomonadota bacterium]